MRPRWQASLDLGLYILFFLPGISALVTHKLVQEMERLDIPPIRFSDGAYARLVTLNAVSSGLLMMFFGWLLAGIGRDLEEQRR